MPSTEPTLTPALRRPRPRRASDKTLRALIHGGAIIAAAGILASAARTTIVVQPQLAQQEITCLERVEPATPRFAQPPPPQPDLAGIAPRTAGVAVTVGAQVLARWTDGNWWRARVDGLGSPGVSVAWQDGSGSMRLGAGDVAPLRPGNLSAGDRALCAWRGGDRWWRAEISHVDDARGQYHVSYIDGDFALVGFHECVSAE